MYILHGYPQRMKIQRHLYLSGLNNFINDILHQRLFIFYFWTHRFLAFKIACSIQKIETELILSISYSHLFSVTLIIIK